MSAEEDAVVCDLPEDQLKERLAMIRREIDLGALLLARSTSGILGGCVVTTSPDPIWPGGSSDAVYLHKLAVARSASGRGLGARLLSTAEAWVLSAQRPRLRLDCWDQNATLRAYYRDLGFEELDSVPSEGTFVRLFEKRLGR